MMSLKLLRLSWPPERAGLRPLSPASIISAALLLVPYAAVPQVDSEGLAATRLAHQPPWVVVSNSTAVEDSIPTAPTSIVSFETTEGTYINVDVSADGRTLVFDLLGDLYLLPIAGGDAIAVTSGRSWDRAPLFSPDGRAIYFVSDRGGYNGVWRLKLGDGSLMQVTSSSFDVRGGPNWSQFSGHLLVGVAERKKANAEVILQAIDPKTGEAIPLNRPQGPWVDQVKLAILRDRLMIFSGVQAPGGEVYFSEARFVKELRRFAVALYSFDPATQARTTLTPSDVHYSEYKPKLSHDGRLLAYFRQYSNRRTEIRILDRNTGRDEALVLLPDADDALYTPHDDSRPNYAFTPDDQSLIFWHDGKIHRVCLADGSSEIVPFKVSVEREVITRAQPRVQYIGETGIATVIRWPSLSRDGQTMAFAATGYIWLKDLRTGDARRLTDSSDLEYMPSVSPDGRFVAYVSFAQSIDGYGPGRLMVANVDDGTTRELLAPSNGTYLLPDWSPDGRKLAAIREVAGDTGLMAAFGWTPVMNPDFHAVSPAPASDSIATSDISARVIGFDAAGQNLLFSYPRSRAETVLMQASLDGNAKSTLAVGSSDVVGIAPAPNLEHLALTRDDGTIWVVPFRGAEGKAEISTAANSARPTSSGAGYYVNWNGESQVVYGFGRQVYRYQLDRHELESLPIQITFDKPQALQPVAFVGARLITMADQDGVGPVIKSGTIVFDKQRIVGVGPIAHVPIPSDSIVIDVTGKTIVPGLIDTHYHRIGGGSGKAIGVSAFKLPNASFSDRSAIRYGITSAWEPGGVQGDGSPATADLQAAGRLIGPRWSHSASGAVGHPWQRLTEYAVARVTAEQHRKLGVDVLKEYLTPTREQRQWLSIAAHDTGAGIVSHLESFYGTMTRIVDGYSGGDHPYIPVPFFKDVRELLRQTGYIWTPNVIITPGTVVSGQVKENYLCDAVSTWQDQKNFKPGGVEHICSSDHRRPDVPYDITRFGRVARQAASAASRGVHVGISGHGMPGYSLHWEMWLLSRGGMPTADVLRAATIGNARKLGLQEEIGSLEAGKIADFLVLEANPLDNILNSLSLKYTVQGGVVYDSNTALPQDLSILRADDVAVPQKNRSGSGL